MTLTNTALAAIRDAAATHLDTTYTHAAVGDDATAEDATDTTLGNEQLRKTFQETTGPTAGVWTASMRIATTEDNGNNIKEVGIFDDPTTGTMLNRKLTTVFAKTASDEVWIDVEFTVTAVQN